MINNEGRNEGKIKKSGQSESHSPRAIRNQPRDQRQRLDVHGLGDDLAAEDRVRATVPAIGRHPPVAGVLAAVEPGHDAVPPVRALDRPPRHSVPERHAAGREPRDGGLHEAG